MFTNNRTRKNVDLNKWGKLVPKRQRQTKDKSGWIQQQLSFEQPVNEREEQP